MGTLSDLPPGRETRRFGNYFDATIADTETIYAGDAVTVDANGDAVTANDTKVAGVAYLDSEESWRAGSAKRDKVTVKTYGTLVANVETGTSPGDVLTAAVSGELAATDSAAAAGDESFLVIDTHTKPHPDGSGDTLYGEVIRL